MSCSLKKYSNIFGEPRKGVHALRGPFDVPVVDWVVTIIAAVLISSKYNVNMWVVMLILLIIAVVLHDVFCVTTPLLSRVI